jgi:hypothetical protein
MGWEETFGVVKRTVLDTPSTSAKVAQGLKKRNSIVEIVPNTFGGVNTHLWRNKAYIVGIVPAVCLAYSFQRRSNRNEWERGGRSMLGWVQYSGRKHGRLHDRKF